MPEEKTTDCTVLSKSALKRQLKRQRIEEHREARKLQRKQLKKEKKSRKQQNRDNDESTRVYHGTKKQDKERLAEALKTGVRLVTDLSLVHLMTDKEARSLCRQLTIAYAENKRSLKPFHLYFTSFTGAFKDLFEEKTPTFTNWKADFLEESYLQVFEEEKESLLYLTPDSKHDLSEYTVTEDQKPAPLSHDSILIVGGLIDRNRHKNACLKQAKEQNLRTACLPLHLLEGTTKGSNVLTTNQCIEILIKYQEQLNWKSAIASVFPQRKRLDQDSPKSESHQDSAD
eukprot:g6964.t1